jgi:hypothetical protein
MYIRWWYKNFQQFTNQCDNPQEGPAAYGGCWFQRFKLPSPSLRNSEVLKKRRRIPSSVENTPVTTEYSETAANLNGNFDTDNQIYVL